MLEALGGAGAELVGAAVHVGVVVAVVVLQGLEHLAGLLAGGGVIQVDQRLAEAGDLAQQREIGAGEGGQVLGKGGRGRWSAGHVDRGGGEGHGRGASSASTITRGCQIAAAAGSSRSTSPQNPRNNRREAVAAAMPRLWR